MTNIPSATSSDDLHARWQTLGQQSHYRAEVIPLEDVDALQRDALDARHAQGKMSPAVYTAESAKLWRTTAQKVGRGDGNFYDFVGCRVRPSGVDGPAYDQHLMREASGAVAMVWCKETDEVLVELKCEPGSALSASTNPFRFAPAVQTSLGRLQQAQQNSQDNVGTLLGVLVGLGFGGDTTEEVQPDPGRNAKANRYDVIEVPNKEVMDAYSKPSMLWTKVAYLYGPNRNLHNGHLRTCLEMYHRRQAAV